MSLGRNIKLLRICGRVVQEKSLKAFLTAALFALLFGHAGKVYSAGPFGPPEPVASEKRSAAIGLGYFWNEVKWKSDNPSEFPTIDVGQNIAFLHAGHFFGEASEIYIRLGMADLQETGSTGSFDGGYTGYTTMGMKGVWYGEKSSKLAIGPVLQGTYNFPYEQNQIPLSIGGTADVKIERYWDISLALGVEWKFSNELIAYGGPFGYFSQAKATINSTVLGESSATYEPKQYLGIYAGVRYAPFASWVLEAEAQYEGKFCGGVTLVYTY